MSEVKRSYDTVDKEVRKLEKAGKFEKARELWKKDAESRIERAEYYQKEAKKVKGVEIEDLLSISASLHNARVHYKNAQVQLYNAKEKISRSLKNKIRIAEKKYADAKKKYEDAIKERELKKQELNKALREYAKRANFEVDLYQNELRRALERYRETKEPIFKLNDDTVNIADIIEVIEKVMFNEKRVSESFWVAPDSDSRYYKDTVLRTEHYLGHLPGARERLPKRPEIVDKWMKEKS